MGEAAGGTSSFYQHPRSDLGWLVNQLFGLAARRTGHSLTLFAETINRRLGRPAVTSHMLEEWERGRGLPPPDVLVAALLAAGADLPHLIESLRAEVPTTIGLPTGDADGEEMDVGTPEVVTSEGGDMRRRDFMRAGGAGLLWAAAFPSLPSAPGAARSEQASRAPLTIDALDSYWQILDQCWVLCNGGQLSVVDRVVHSLLADLVQESADRPAAAALTSQCLRLLSIVRTHELKLGDKIAVNQRAVEYARQGGDPTTLVAALTELAVAFKYADQPGNSFATYLEAVTLADSAAPLVRSRAYAAAAAAYAQRSLSKEATTYIDLARQSFPTAPEKEPHWLSADYGIWLLAFYEGVTQLAAGRASEADRAFGAYLEHPMARLTPERNRLEILNQRSRAAILLGEIEPFAEHLRAALAGATAIGSRKRFDEALAVYRGETPADWRRHPIVVQVAEEFPDVLRRAV